MAQLKDSVIDGDLEVVNDIILKTTNRGVQGVHPETGEVSRMLHMSEYGNTIVGYGGYANQNGNAHIYGNDVVNFIASADDSYRPYYRAGDVISFNVRTSGYVTNSCTYVVFTIPITKPVIGAPTATASSDNGFVLRQNNSYTHGSNGAASPTVFAVPTGYSVLSNYNGGFVVTAYFDDTTNATNNDAIGVFWNGTITLS